MLLYTSIILAERRLILKDFESRNATPLAPDADVTTMVVMEDNAPNNKVIMRMGNNTTF